MANGFNNKPDFVRTSVTNAFAGTVGGGIFSTRPVAKYSSGARCVLKINNNLVGFAFGITWRINTLYTEINTIDDYVPAELAPQRVTVEGTISALHIPGQSATASFWQPDLLSFLFHKYITIEVKDSQTDELLFYTSNAVIVSRTEDIKVDQLSNVTLSFKAIGWRDEKEPDFPKNYDGESPAAVNGKEPSKNTGLGLDVGSSLPALDKLSKESVSAEVSAVAQDQLNKGKAYVDQTQQAFQDNLDNAKNNVQSARDVLSGKKPIF